MDGRLVPLGRARAGDGDRRAAPLRRRGHRCRAPARCLRRSSGRSPRAASPTNSTRPSPAVERGAIDARRDRPRLGRRLGPGAASPSTSAMCGRRIRSSAAHLLARRADARRSRRWPDRPGSGNDHAYPGRKSGSNHTQRSAARARRRSSTAGTRATRPGSRARRSHRAPCARATTRRRPRSR